MIRLPVLPTLLVGAAVATMIGLGVWQLFWRAPQKDALLASYEAAQGLPPVAYPAIGAEPLPLFRRSNGHCLQVTRWRHVAGENEHGQIGYAFLADCRTGAEGPGMVVDAGWATDPRIRPSWTGGAVSGVIAPDRDARVRLVSTSGLGGLQASAPPSPAMIRNSHRSYAFQWFAFAVIASVIYFLALRKRSGADAAA